MYNRLIAGMSGRVTRWSAIIVPALVAIAFIVFVIPRLIVPSATAGALRDVADSADRHTLVDSRLKLQNDVRTTMLQMLGGFALLAGAYLTYRQLRLNHEDHRAVYQGRRSIGQRELGRRSGWRDLCSRADRSRFIGRPRTDHGNPGSLRAAASRGRARGECRSRPYRGSSACRPSGRGNRSRASSGGAPSLGGRADQPA
jgi:hypothetical protein